MGGFGNKKILLGVTGGIAAYKAAELVRLLVKEGAAVRVVMTEGAQKFITPLTMQALSSKPVHTELLDPQAEAGMGHIALARWPDLILIAPASANFIARLSQGLADDLLSTLCLATAAPIVLAPAMNHKMWANAATQTNCEVLAARGIELWGPASGEQACGEVGPGRMLESSELVQRTRARLVTGALEGKTVVITAGPTQEPIDPVRYLSNRSSGKMGYALAEAALEAGAQVVLISGPTALADVAGAHIVRVRTGEEMLQATASWLGKMDVFIGAAAVSDYRPERAATHKLKKHAGDDVRTLKLIKNPDIVAWVAASTPRPYTVGFAAETEHLTRYARGKLESKRLDMVIANDVSQSHLGFHSDRNAVEVIQPNATQTLTERSKKQLARELVAIITDAMQTETK